jgi:hypothetical protein
MLSCPLEVTSASCHPHVPRCSLSLYRVGSTGVWSSGSPLPPPPHFPVCSSSKLFSFFLFVPAIVFGLGRRHLVLRGLSALPFFFSSVPVPQLLSFIDNKSSCLYHQKKKAAQLRWTQVWRRNHKKSLKEAVAKKQKKRAVHVQRAVGGLSLEALKAKKAEKPAQRQVAQAEALRYDPAVTFSPSFVFRVWCMPALCGSTLPKSTYLNSVWSCCDVFVCDCLESVCFSYVCVCIVFRLCRCSCEFFCVCLVFLLCSFCLLSSVLLFLYVCTFCSFYVHGLVCCFGCFVCVCVFCRFVHDCAFVLGLLHFF